MPPTRSQKRSRLEFVDAKNKVSDSEESSEEQDNSELQKYYEGIGRIRACRKEIVAARESAYEAEKEAKTEARRFMMEPYPESVDHYLVLQALSDVCEVLGKDATNSAVQRTWALLLHDREFDGEAATRKIYAELQSALTHF